MTDAQKLKLRESAGESRRTTPMEWALLGLSIAGYVTVYLSVMWLSPAILIIGLTLSLSVAVGGVWLLVRAAPDSDLQSEEIDALVAGDPIQTVAIRFLRWRKRTRALAGEKRSSSSEAKA